MSDNMLKNAIEKIAEMAAPTVREIHGQTWTSKELHPVPAVEDEPETYIVNTLEGLVNLIQREGIAKLATEATPLFVVVREPDLVEVDSSYLEGQDTFFLRMHPYRAASDVPGFRSGFRPLEEMVIQLRAQCADTKGRAELLELLSTVSVEDGVSTMDNGVTQTVTQRSGAALLKTAAVKPYVALQPYRTFLEVEQPESEFLLRLDGEGHVGLFEADGGAWKLEAKRRIRNWLAKALEKEVDAGRVVVTI